MIIDKEDDMLKITEIGADCQVIPPFPLRSEVIKDVNYLDLSFNRLRTLEGLHLYLNLETLVLDNNNLADDIFLPVLPRLRVLSLNKNNICDLSNLLELLKISTPNLEFLSLLVNPCCPNEMVNKAYTEADYNAYRLKVTKHLPSLVFLDSRLVTRRERKSSRRRKQVGPLDAVRIEEMFPSTVYTKESTEVFSTATYGRLMAKYRGKHSEGNRFIRDHDL